MLYTVFSGRFSNLPNVVLDNEVYIDAEPRSLFPFWTSAPATGSDTTIASEIERWKEGDLAVANSIDAPEPAFDSLRQ